jgi:hypothetical protein
MALAPVLPDELLDSAGGFLELFAITLLVVAMMVFVPAFSIFAK